MTILAIVSAIFVFLILGNNTQALEEPSWLSQRPQVGKFFDGAFPPEPPTLPSDFRTVVAFSNLSFINPIGLAPIPGTDRLAVWEREGRIWTFTNDPLTSEKTMILDLSDRCFGWDDCGLLGVAFHPDFNVNGQVYLWYSRVEPGTVTGGPASRPAHQVDHCQRLSRFTWNAATSKLENEYVVIDQVTHDAWHSGGGMFFHPENGFLYLSNGNGFSAANDQRIDRGFFGCVIRIDIDKRGGTISRPPTKRAWEEVGANWPDAYYIPNDNPFVWNPEALGEIYALGLRNPYRMSYDASSKRIFIGDVGERSAGEVSIIEPGDPPGLNFQWPQIDGYGYGSHGRLVGSYAGVSKSPNLEYRGIDGNAIVGGCVYRGSSFPELQGRYIFGDNGSNRIWAMDESTFSPSTPATKSQLATMPKGAGPNPGRDYTGLSSIGIDSRGELYFCQLSSVSARIYKLERGHNPRGQNLPQTLSATRLFNDMASLTPSPKLIPYTLNVPFWSDGALKSRWAAIPTGAKIGFTAKGEWDWPIGSVFVKHFEMPIDGNAPMRSIRLETRVLVKTAGGSVYGATYKWRPDNSDADLLDSGSTEGVSAAFPLGELTSTEIGNTSGGSIRRSANEFEISAGEGDISGSADQFNFAYQIRSGDFDIQMRIPSADISDSDLKVGIMARESLESGSRNVSVLALTADGYGNEGAPSCIYRYRDLANGPSVVLNPISRGVQLASPNTWVRLRRNGDIFSALSSSDGLNWSEFARNKLSLARALHVGIAATAHTSHGAGSTKVNLQETRLTPWTYPSRAECMSCHSTNSGGVLGPKTRQMNGNHPYPDGTNENQIRSWSRAGLFDRSPADSEIPGLDSLAATDDVAASLEKRARSYLDANCASCHRPGGVSSAWDARFDTPLSDQGIIYGRLANNLGAPSARMLVPGDVKKSILFHRLSTTDGALAMPPLAKNRTDPAGVDLIEKWIAGMAINPSPEISLEIAGANADSPPGTPIKLAANASDKDGISRVEFFDGANLIGESLLPPYEITLAGGPGKAHSLAAVATDSVGNTGISRTIQLQPALGNSFGSWHGLKTHTVALLAAIHLVAIIAVAGCKKRPSL